jgi:hypothetical protein
MSSSAGPGVHYQPYESAGESSDDESSSVHTGLTSVSDTESTGTSESERITHDGRLQAMDEWRATASTWISAPGRRPVADRLLPLRPPPVGLVNSATVPSAMELPLELRASDVRRHIINIDSQFRESPESSTAADFFWRLLAPIRNVMRIRVSSVELPNNYHFFTRQRLTVTFSLTYGAGAHVIYRIQDGNYTAGDMVDAVLAILQSVNAGFAMTFSEVTGKFTVTHPTTPFTLNFVVDGETWDRPFAYGLGYYMGFTRQESGFAATVVGGKYTVISDACASFQGDNYLFLRVNDFNCVRHTMSVSMPGMPLQNNDFVALAKIVIREPKNFMTFDDYGSQHIKEVVFNAPRDLERFHVELVDAYGKEVDLCSAQFSFSLEVLEILNPTLYDTVRNTLMLRYV